jgi:hypothetical protein
MNHFEQESFNPASPSAAELEEEIKRRAYQLYEERGCTHGFDLDDWLQAEAEVLDARDIVIAA